MSKDLGRWDIRFRYTLVAAAVITGIIDTWNGGNHYGFKALFVITVGGLVGYFTNYLAIKMLFQPKRGKVFGWSGLVPQNQSQIARSLGESVQEQLLSPEIILAYIKERQLIDATTRRLADWVDSSVQRPEVRRRIAELLVEIVGRRGPDLLASSFDFIEEAGKGIARNPELIATYWEKLRSELAKQLADQSNRGEIAKHSRKVMQKQLPDVAFWMNRTLENYLSNKKAVGNLGRGLKRLVSFDEKNILELLERFYQDPALTEEFMGILDAVIDGIQRELTSDSTQALVQDSLEEWVGKIADITRKTVLPTAVSQFDDYLADEKNWLVIEGLVVQAIQWCADQAGNLLESEKGRAYVSAGIENAVQRLNVTELVEEQVMKLDTDELEKMVLDNTGGNLTVIQILGGTLGMIIGTVQVNILFVIPIACLTAAVWFAYIRNERRQDLLAS